MDCRIDLTTPWFPSFSINDILAQIILRLGRGSLGMIIHCLTSFLASITSISPVGTTGSIFRHHQISLGEQNPQLRTAELDLGWQIYTTGTYFPIRNRICLHIPFHLAQAVLPNIASVNQLRSLQRIKLICYSWTRRQDLGKVTSSSLHVKFLFIL